jgi:hypothetical protein
VTAATTREYIVYSPIEKKIGPSPPYQQTGKSSAYEDLQGLTVQVWQEYAREVGGETEDGAHEQCLKRCETCSPRGT